MVTIHSTGMRVAARSSATAKQSGGHHAPRASPATPATPRPTRHVLRLSAQHLSAFQQRFKTYAHIPTPGCDDDSTGVEPPVKRAWESSASAGKAVGQAEAPECKRPRQGDVDAKRRSNAVPVLGRLVGGSEPRAIAKDSVAGLAQSAPQASSEEIAPEQLWAHVGRKYFHKTADLRKLDRALAAAGARHLAEATPPAASTCGPTMKQLLATTRQVLTDLDVVNVPSQLTQNSGGQDALALAEEQALQAHKELCERLCGSVNKLRARVPGSVQRAITRARAVQEAAVVEQYSLRWPQQDAIISRFVRILEV